MLWFSVWTVLVLATLAGGFFLGRDLWRKAKALTAELARAAEVAAALGERVDQLATAAAAAPSSHDLFTDPAGPRRWLAELREARAGRREVRRLRHDRTRQSWRAYWT